MVLESEEGGKRMARRGKGERGQGNVHSVVLVKLVLPIILLVVIVGLLVMICVLRSKLKKATTFNQRMAEAEKGIQIEDVSVKSALP